MPKKNTILNHTVEQYNKKYKNLNYRLLRVTKKEVEDFNKTHNTTKGYLLEGRKWWLIKDTYYQIPKPLTFTWFRNLDAAIQVGTCVLLAGAVGGGTVGTIYAVDASIPRYTITFNTRVDEKINPIKVKQGNRVSKPKEPYKQFCAVKYWYKGEDNTIPYDFNTPVTESFTLTPIYYATETKVKVKGLNFNGTADCYSTIQDMYDGCNKIVFDCLKDATSTIDSADKFKNTFTDIEENDNEINANLTFELYTKDNETHRILAETGGAYVYSLGRAKNYCGTDAKSNKKMFINKITFKSGSDDKAKLYYQTRISYASTDPHKDMTAMLTDTNNYHCSSYEFYDLDIDNYEIQHNNSTRDNYSLHLIKNENTKGQNLIFDHCNFNQNVTLRSWKKLVINNCYFYQDLNKHDIGYHKYAVDDSAIYLYSEYNDTSSGHEIHITNNIIDNYPRGMHLNDLSATKLYVQNNKLININQNANKRGNCGINISKNATNNNLYIENNIFENVNCNALKVHSAIENTLPNIFVNYNIFNTCQYLGYSKASKDKYKMTSIGNKIDKNTCIDKCEISDSGGTSSDPNNLIILN